MNPTPEQRAAWTAAEDRAHAAVSRSDAARRAARTRGSRKIHGEYVAVSGFFLREWPTLYELLRRAHGCGISRAHAERLVRHICPKTRLKFGRRLGYADSVRNYISLPGTHRERRDGVPLMRLGLVLHECAHIHAGNAAHHGPKFCAALARLLKTYAEQEIAFAQHYTADPHCTCNDCIDLEG